VKNGLGGVGLFPAASSSAFILDAKSELESNPNEAIVAHMQVLIHTVSNSRFPDLDPGSVTETGSPPNSVTIQFIFYASLATLLFAVFLAMLEKLWVNRSIQDAEGLLHTRVVTDSGNWTESRSDTSASPPRASLKRFETQNGWTRDYWLV
jgi:hypothetical protein